MKNLFIFLGESEIYTIDEFDRNQKLIASESNLFQKLRDLRKIGWIEDDNKELSSIYHKAKCQRGIQKIFQKFGIHSQPKDFGNIQKMSEAIEALLKKVTPQDLPQLQNREFNVFSDYLGFQVAQSQDCFHNRDRVLNLPFPYGLILLAIVPSTNIEGSLKADINLLRTNVSLKKIHDDLLEIEIILLSAVYRARFEIFPWMPEKIRSLQRHLAH